MSEIEGFKDNVNYLERQNKRVYLLVYCIIFFIMIFINGYTDQLDFLNSSNTLFISPNDFEESLYVHELDLEDQHHYEYTVGITEENLPALEGDEYRLIINGLKDNGVKVWFNKQLIISEGDIEEGKSMLRSNHVYGSLDKANIQPDNELKIQSFASYRTGTDDQILISEKRIGDRAIRLLDLYNNQFIYLGIGLMLMSVIFLAFLYLLDRERDRLIFYLGMATLLIGIYFFDFLPHDYLQQNYLFYKKLILASLSLGIYFYGRAIHSLINKKYIMVLPAIQLLYYFFTMFTSDNIIEFRSYYLYFYLSFLIIGGSFLVITFVHRNKDNKLFLLTLHFIPLFLLGLLILRVGDKHNYFSPAMPLYAMMTVAFLPLLLAIDFLLNKKINIQLERELKDIAYSHSITDGLTGVWNKRYLEKCLSDLSEGTVLALLDLDNLKTINDNYGHLAGDQALISLTEKIQKYLGEDDCVCRYGGDEFVVIFDKVKLREAVEIMEGIRQSIASETLIYNEIEINLTISVGLAVVNEKFKGEKIIELADQRLYEAKENGRNQIVYPELIF